MALKATIYKATVNVADLDRNQFLDASLTLAPSFQKPGRMMLRLLAWLKYADERLQFTRGLCADDEPEAWLRNDHWALIYGLNWGCRMSDGLRKPALRPQKWRCLPIIVGRRKSGGSKIRANVRSLPIFPSGIWTMNNWRK